MARVKELMLPFAILVVAGMAMYFVANRQKLVEAALIDTSIPMPPANPRLEAAIRDYPWYVAMSNIERGDLESHIEEVAYANSANPGEKAEDHRRGQIVADRLAEARRRLPIAAKITKETGDPLPFWAASAMLARAKADWLLRQEVLKALNRPHQEINPGQRCALERDCVKLAGEVRQYWSQHLAGVGSDSTYPVTLP